MTTAVGNIYEADFSGLPNEDPLVSLPAGLTAIQGQFRILNGVLFQDFGATSEAFAATAPSVTAETEVLFEINHDQTVFSDTSGVGFHTTTGNGYSMQVIGGQIIVRETSLFDIFIPANNIIVLSSQTYVSGDVFGLRWNPSNGDLTITRNGSTIGSGNNTTYNASSNLRSSFFIAHANVGAAGIISFAVNDPNLISGTLSETLDNVTSTATGSVTQDVTGTLSETLDNITSTASGTLNVLGTVSETLDNVASTASGLLTISGSLSETLDPITSTVTGTVGVAPSGTLSETLDNIGLASNAIVGTSTLLNNPLAAQQWITAESVTAGDERFNAGRVYTADNTGTTGTTAPVHASGSVSDGTVSWTFDRISQSVLDGYTGDAPITGDRVVYDDTTSPDNIPVGVDAQGFWTLDTPPTQNQTINVQVVQADGTAGNIATYTFIASLSGTLSETLDNVTSAIAAALSVQGSLSETLDNVTVVATGFSGNDVTGSLSQTLDDFTSTFATQVTIFGTAAPPILDLAQATATGFIGVPVTGSLSETLDDTTSDVTAFVGSGVLGFLSEILDDVTIVSSGTVQVGTASGSVSSILDPVTSTVSGIVGSSAGTANITLEGVTLAAVGGLSLSGTVNVTLQDFISVGLAEAPENKIQDIRAKASLIAVIA